MTEKKEPFVLPVFESAVDDVLRKAEIEQGSREIVFDEANVLGAVRDIALSVSPDFDTLTPKKRRLVTLLSFYHLGLRAPKK